MPAVKEIGIDLGTSTISVFVKGKGIIINEPALVAFDKDANKIRAIGEEAKQLVGHASGNIIAIRPLSDGKISDFLIMERMLKYFIEKSMGRRGLLKPRISLCLPSGVTEVEKRAVIDATYQAGAGNVVLVEEPIAAAIGAEIDIAKAFGNMIVDVGGGLTEIAVISMCGIVVSDSIPIGGDQFTKEIITYLRDTYGLFIGEQGAEELKLRLGSTTGDGTDKTEVRGRDVRSGTPKNIVITREDVLAAFEKPMRQIARAVRNILGRTPPDLSADLLERGMLLAGGGCRVIGLEAMLSETTGLQVLTTEHPETVVALGTGRYRAMIKELGL